MRINLSRFEEMFICCGELGDFHVGYAEMMMTDANIWMVWIDFCQTFQT